MGVEHELNAFLSSHAWLVILELTSILLVFLGMLLIVQILRTPRLPAATLGWLLAIVLLPHVGIPLYLLVGTRKIKKKARHKPVIALDSGKVCLDHEVHRLLVSMGMPASSVDNKVSFHADGAEAFASLQEVIGSARKRIEITIFILSDDEVGRAVLALLEKKAREGIAVRLLLDGVGSFLLPRSKLRGLEQAGGEVAWFNPVLHRPLRGRTNLRNHRKMVIADVHRVWAGGRNIDDDYLSADGADGEPDKLWVDLSFEGVGQIAAVYRSIFCADWNYATHSESCKERVAVEGPVVDEANAQSHVQVVPSGPDVVEDPYYAGLLSAVFSARRRVQIVTPYYVPESGVQEALRLAALKGVRVDLVLPEHSNHRLADIARERFLRELAGAGVNIWLLPQQMVHAKAVVVDEDFAMAGSGNLDVRSLFLNFEVMSCFYSHSDVVWLSQWTNQLQSRCRPYQLQEVGGLRELMEGSVLLLAYQL